MLLVVILVLIMFVVIYNTLDPNEHFKKVETESVKIEPVKTKIDLVSDPLFKDVTIYENENIDYINNTGTLGIEKCINKCKGRCVEWGITGVAYCYPSDDKEVIKAYEEGLVQTSEEKLEKLKKLNQNKKS